MFAAQNQIYVLIVCLSIGVIGGIIYEAVDFLKRFINNRLLKDGLDLLFFIVFSFLAVGLGYLYEFPSLRWFMPAAELAGVLLERKSIHIIVAKFADKVYNKLIKLRRKKQNDRGKGKEAGSVVHGDGGAVSVCASVRARLSARFAKSNKEQKRELGSRKTKPDSAY